MPDTTSIAVKIPDAPPSVPMQGSEATAIIAMIERAARDDTVNIDKMRELLAMRKEIMAQEAAQAFAISMTLAQAQMRPVAADAANTQTRSKYASYFAIDNAVRPIYTAHGFGLSFDTGTADLPLHTRVLCLVSHDKGHMRQHHVDIPSDGKGAKGGDVMTKTHATGSALSYGQRYLIKMIFNIAVGGDDDGNRAGGRVDRITQEQVANLRDLASEVGADMPRFLQYMSKVAGREVLGLGDIPAIHFQAAVTSLRMKGAADAKAEAARAAAAATSTNGSAR